MNTLLYECLWESPIRKKLPKAEKKMRLGRSRFRSRMLQFRSESEISLRMSQGVSQRALGVTEALIQVGGQRFLAV